jgi:hypothetical protein
MWHYTQDGRTQGPVQLDELTRRVLAGELPRDVLVWREGLAEWMPADLIPKLAHDLGRPAAPAAPGTEAGPPVYFAVSRAKLIVMSLATLGFYRVYWFYQHWHRQRERTQEDLSPFWRTVFSIFFAYDLFTRLRDEAGRNGIAPRYRAGWAAAGYIVPSLMFRLPDPWWLVTLLSVVPLVAVQGTANALNAAITPGADRNGRLSALNVTVVVLGGVLWLLLLLAFYVELTA